MNLFRSMFFPDWLRKGVESRPELKRIFLNSLWLYGDRALRMGAGLVVLIVLARHLGPAQYGQLNYALAFVGLFIVFAELGLSGVVIRDIVLDPSCTFETLGTAFVLRVAGGVSALLLAITAISVLHPEDAPTRFMVMLLGFTLVFKSSEVVKYWYESQVLSKYTAWVDSSIFLTFSVVKIVLIALGAPLIAFVWALVVESACLAAGFLFAYHWRQGALSAWRPRLQRAKRLLQESWLLILSGLAVITYMRIDQIMLGEMVGNDAVGIYAAAMRISEAWYFFPLAIVASAFPSIMEAKKAGDARYGQRLQRLYDLVVLMAFAFAVPMTFLSDWVIGILYGEAYKGAGIVLAIHIWASVFVFLGVISSKWMLLENLQLMAFQRALLGALANIALNLALIPRYGTLGAAMATVISFSIAALWFDLFSKKTRATFGMKLKSLTLQGVRFYLGGKTG